MLQQIFNLPNDQPELPAEKRGLYQLLAAGVPAIATFQPLIGLSMFVIAGLTMAGYLDTPEQIHLLWLVGGINLLNGLLHLPILNLIRRNQLNAVAFLLVVLNGSFSAAQILLWKDVLWFPLGLVSAIIGVFLIVPGFRRLYKLLIFLIGVVLFTLILFLDTQIAYPRLHQENLSHYLALFLYIVLTFAMVAIGAINGLVNFQAISRRMVSNFTTLTVITILVFITVGTFSNYLDSRKRAYEQLEIITNLKTAQIELLLERLHQQVSQPLEDTTVLRLVQSILKSNPENAITKIDLEVFRSYLSRLPRQADEEYLLIDANGRVLLSTNRNMEGMYVASYTLLEKARQAQLFSIEKDFPGAPVRYSLFVIQPINQAEQFLGMLVFRTTFGAINNITKVTPTTSKTLETYLVSRIEGLNVPMTEIRQNVEQIDTPPTRQAFGQFLTNIREEYWNYAEKEVFGHFVFIPQLQSVLISEIEQDEALASLFTALPVYLALGSVMILLSIVTVLTISQTISRPLEEVAQKAALLAGGKRDIRITSHRQDELGALAAIFNKMSSELQDLVRTLETRVAERTQELQKQANYLRIAAEVARDATTAQDLEELLHHAAQLVLERFNFYHTGIFLIDPDNEYAVLRASPTEAGRRMLEQGHRLKVGQTGLVGYVAAAGVPRIALDTSQDAAYFNNPLLPNTRSEVAIPLKIGDQILGVLDVQSTEPEAFTQDDIATLQVMADQLALAIQRVQLVSELQRNLNELNNTYASLTTENWQKFSQQFEFKPGYVFDGFQAMPLQSLPENAQQMLSKGRTIYLESQRDEQGATILTPLKFREQVLGGIVLRFHTPNVDRETINLVEETAARLAGAMENARLYSESQHLVQRERAVSEISKQITSSFNIETILRTAVTEIGKRLPDAEVIVELKQEKD